jgi:hypothetical protein
VIDSADQRADGGVRKVVGVGYLVILAKAAAGRWNLGGCFYPGAPRADRPEDFHQLLLRLYTEPVIELTAELASLFLRHPDSPPAQEATAVSAMGGLRNARCRVL